MPTEGILVASSPMLRCLQTILPTVRNLDLPQKNCLVHGGGYEFACAGTAFAGTPQSSILARFPDFAPVCFGADGLWDYRGSSARETQEEARERAVRLFSWIWETAEAH